MRNSFGTPCDLTASDGNLRIPVSRLTCYIEGLRGIKIFASGPNIFFRNRGNSSRVGFFSSRRLTVRSPRRMLSKKNLLNPGNVIFTDLPSLLNQDIGKPHGHLRTQHKKIMQKTTVIPSMIRRHCLKTRLCVDQHVSFISLEFC